MKQKIYVDMDGVIADHFNYLGTVNGYSRWKDIPDIETAHTQLWNTDHFYHVPCYWGDIEDSTLPNGWTPKVKENKSQKLIQYVRDICDEFGFEYGICSSPIKGDFNNSSYWKRRWLERHDMMPDKVENCLFVLDKTKYATCRMIGLPNILIDDRPDNIHKFNAAGGVGIRFQHDEDDLEEYLFDALLETVQDIAYR